jgi:hypothetical protein
MKSCQRAAAAWGRRVRDTNPFPCISYNALAEVDAIEIGFEMKLK